MALWQNDNTGEQFDDQLAARPGEDAFTRDVAAQHFGHGNFSYQGTPNWVAPVQADPNQGATQ